MDGCGNTSRMDTAYQTIKLHSGRLNGLFYTSRLIPRVSLDVQVILSSSVVRECIAPVLKSES